MKTKTSKNKKKLKGSSAENPEVKKGKSENDHPESETIRIDGFIPKEEMIKSIKKYHPNKTRHMLAIILVISLVLSIIVFGILHAVVEKEMVESMKDFSRYSITVLCSLTGAAIGFFFGRDLKEPQ